MEYIRCECGESLPEQRSAASRTIFDSRTKCQKRAACNVRCSQKVYITHRALHGGAEDSSPAYPEDRAEDIHLLEPHSAYVDSGPVSATQASHRHHQTRAVKRRHSMEAIRFLKAASAKASMCLLNTKQALVAAVRTGTYRSARKRWEKLG